jgi:hypothetical protein
VRRLCDVCATPATTCLGGAEDGPVLGGYASRLADVCAMPATAFLGDSEDRPVLGTCASRPADVWAEHSSGVTPID